MIFGFDDFCPEVIFAEEDIAELEEERNISLYGGRSTLAGLGRREAEEERKKEQTKVKKKNQLRQAQGDKMQLPTEKTKKENDTTRLTVTLHGPPKIGKTTFISKMDNVLIVATEAGHKHIEAYVQPVSSWLEFLQTAKSLTTEKHQFKGIAIDTVDNLVGLCRRHVLAENKIAHESDLAFGKGYALIQQEFSRVLDKLTLSMGVWFISHTIEKDIENYLGKKHTKRVPSLPNKQRDYVVGISDCVLFADIEQEEGKFKRVLRCQNSNDWEAGDRSGLLPRTLPLDYNAFKSCFEGVSATKFQQARELTGADTINAAIAFGYIDDLKETASQIADEKKVIDAFEQFEGQEISNDSQAAELIVAASVVFNRIEEGEK